MVVHVTDGGFKKLVERDVPVVIDFWAEWCGPCRMVGPVIEELANDYEGKAIMAKMNVDENDEVPGEYGIRSIPTILFFRNGVLKDKHVGAASKSVLEGKLKAIL